MLYSVFVDDSGNKEYPKRYPYNRLNVTNPPLWEDANTGFWRDNYFILCGIRVKNDDIAKIDAEINQLKVDCFGTANVEIKSTWLRGLENRLLHYVTPFSLTDERVKQFGDDFIELIRSHKDELKIIAVAFDKRCIRRREVYHPLLVTTQMMLERIHMMGDENIVIFDQMDPQLTITKGYGKKMLQVFTDNTGVENIFITQYSNIKNFVPRSSEKENFLQVADACAYAINKQFMKYGREWLGNNRNSDGRAVLTIDRVFEKLKYNLHCHGKKKTVVGYGLTLFPHEKTMRVDWDFFSSPAKKAS